MASLTTYRKKRSFEKTPEPTGGKSKGERVYVIQKHDATRLHYDFRLEHKGVLLSWAVPKGPSTDPTVKRLAVHVEDHPLDYATFEGTIPEGNYGAGTVEIWDSGTWTPVNDVDKGMENGELKVDIHGKRLNGRWVLVRMGPPSDKENWLLIKERDSSEEPSLEAPKWKPDTKFQHQLCELRAHPPTGDGWRFEIKWDGYRAFLVVGDGKPRFVSRNGNDLGLSDLAEKIAKGISATAIIDGELVALNEKGLSDFGKLQAQIGGPSGKGLRFVAFDLLRLNDLDLRPLELKRRVELLERLHAGKQAEEFMLSPAIDGEATAIVASACNVGLEGVVAKRLSSPYEGVRSTDWIKVKCRRIGTGIVVGYNLFKGDDKATGALVLARRSGGKLTYLGRVGTGFSHAERSALFKRFQSMGVAKAPVTGLTTEERRGVHWIEPKVEIQFEYAEITNKGILRQASYLGEKGSSSAVVETPIPAPAFKPTTVKLTHPERVIDPESGATKKDLFDYYHQFGSLMMPFLKDRLVAMVRCPEGVSGECFFQKHIMKGAFKGVVEVPDEDEVYVSLKNETGVLEMVQMNVLEFHPWGSQIRAIEKPDVLIFDLDPAPEVSWDAMLEAADFVRDQLVSVGFEPFYKLSGGKGIHLVLSIKPELEWPDAKALCKSFAEQMVSQRPKQFLSNMSKAQRKGKIFIDYLRNGRGATAVAPYCVRSRPGLPIAMPLTWEELQGTRSSAQFTLADAADYLTSRKSDPWADFFKKRVSVKKLFKI